MAREQMILTGPGSADQSIWDIMKKVLFNERGEVGLEESGDELDAGNLGEEEGEGQGEEEGQGGALPIKEGQEAESGQEEGEGEPEPEGEEGEAEGEGEGGEGESAEGEGEGEQEVSPDMKALQDRISSLESEATTNRQMAEFYQKQYNEVVGASETQDAFGKTIKPGTQDKAESQGEEGKVALEEPPTEPWENTKQAVDFFDKRINTHIENNLNQRVEEYVQPMFQRASLAIEEVINRVLKPQMEGYDDVMSEVNNELFVMDPTGQTVVAVRNPGLLQYFKAQPLPHIAMYDYGKGKKSTKEMPEKIKKGTEKATKETLKKIAKKPKGTKDIKSGQPAEEVTLDWNTPSAQAEKALADRGLIPK